MEISRHGNIDVLGKLLLGIQGTDRPAGKKSAAGGGQDRVEISAQAKEIGRIKELVTASDPERAERVAQLRQVVEQGTYRATGRAVADGIIRQTLLDSVL